MTLEKKAIMNNVKVIKYLSDFFFVFCFPFSCNLVIEIFFSFIKGDHLRGDSHITKYGLVNKNEEAISRHIDLDDDILTAGQASGDLYLQSFVTIPPINEVLSLCEI